MRRLVPVMMKLFSKTVDLVVEEQDITVEVDPVVQEDQDADKEWK